MERSSGKNLGVNQKFRLTKNHFKMRWSVVWRLLGAYRGAENESGEGN